MIEQIQIKGYMCEIQLSGEEISHLLSKSNTSDGRLYSLNAFSMSDTVLEISHIYDLIWSTRKLKAATIIIPTYERKKYNTGKLKPGWLNDSWILIELRNRKSLDHNCLKLELDLVNLSNNFWIWL